jgi:hypothetical protein
MFMTRAAIGVIIGYLVWTLFWLGGNAAFFGQVAKVVAAGEPVTDAGVLVSVMLMSIVCSIAAGVCAGVISKQRRGAVLVMGVLLLATGIGVQIGVWQLMPVWYHITFLGLIVPACVFGGRIATGLGR